MINVVLRKFMSKLQQQSCLFRYSWSNKDFIYLSMFYKFGEICFTKRLFIYLFFRNSILFDETRYISCMMKQKDFTYIFCLSLVPKPITDIETFDSSFQVNLFE